jgi:hypothetical protein
MSSIDYYLYCMRYSKATIAGHAHRPSHPVRARQHQRLQPRSELHWRYEHVGKPGAPVTVERRQVQKLSAPAQPETLPQQESPFHPVSRILSCSPTTQKDIPTSFSAGNAKISMVW